MIGDSNAGFATSLPEPLNVRMETLQEVLMGHMSPLERRLEIASRRQSIVFGAMESHSTSSSLESTVEDSSSDEEPDQERSGFETADSVEVEVESPSDDALRAANSLAEKHSQAKTIALASENTIEVREAPGGTFVVDVPKVLERELGEDPEAETVDSSVASMSTAAAEKLG